jgi:Flp pilus assembly protein TadG
MRALRTGLHSLRDVRRSEGQALVLFAAGLVAFCGLVAMSVDVGRYLVERRNEQNAADAAALAGAAILEDGGTHAQAVAAALDYASKNGYSASEVTVNHPPASGSSAGSQSAIEVVIQHDVEKYFAQVVYSGAWRPQARAVGKVTNTQSGFGVITLNPSQCQSLTMNSNAQLQVTGGGIYVDSNCAADAFYMASNATATANAIDVVGGFSGQSNYHATPQPVTHAPIQPDPFASIPVPPTKYGTDRTGGGCNFGGNGNYTFNPGIYNCRMTFSSNSTATFNPGDYFFVGGFQTSSNVTITWGRGIYTMVGGGLQMDSNSVIKDPASGQKGVLIYNTCSSGSCAPGAASGPFQMNSNAGLQVSYYGGSYSAIVIWEDRNSIQPLQFNSNSLTTTGAIYSKSADIQYNSNAAVPMQFVANNVQMNSNARIVVNVSGLATVGTKTMGLSE